MEELRGEGLAKVFPDGTRALDGVSFVARPGKVLTLLGPSGCGKSTLLRVVAGLERASEGRLTLGGRPLDDLAPGERDIGFVFQNYALYPHMTVARNLSLALEVRRLGRREIDARVAETAALLGIEPLLSRRPAQLSGGQQQRVALGRALVRRPKLYLLDEPLSNLDALLREGMRTELKALFGRLGATVLYVTHDQAEAMSLSDQVAVMRSGRVLQSAPPLEIYRRPADLFVATFVGTPQMTVWRGRREGAWFVPAEGGDAPQLAVPEGLGAAPELLAGIRPEDVELAAQPLEGGFAVETELAEPLGASVLLTLRAGRARLRALARVLPHRLWARLPPDRVHWFDAGSERRLEPASRASSHLVDTGDPRQ